MKAVFIAVLLLLAGSAHAGQRYLWECHDDHGKAAPGRTVAEALAPQQMHFIFSDGAPGRKLVGQHSDGVCSAATLVMGQQTYQCVPQRPLDSGGRPGKAVDRTSCAKAQ